jgi:hypothetical protein
VVRRAHAQTRDCAGEKACEDVYVFVGRCGVAESDAAEDGYGEEEKKEAAEEVCVDVYGLVVQVGEGVEGFGVGV